jgi:hypothetical protein
MNNKQLVGRVYSLEISPAIQVAVGLQVALNYSSTVESIYVNGFQTGKPGRWAQWGQMTVAAFRAPGYQIRQLKELRDESRRKTNGAANSVTRWGYFAQLQKALSTSKTKALKAGSSFIEKSNLLPELTTHSSASIFLRAGLTGKRYQDKAKAKSQAKRAIGIWHHHEVMGIMQSVTATAHSAVFHYGGVYFWSVCNNQTYKK